MQREVRQYLAQIGARGGRKSRRLLTRFDAQQMVKLREARKAFRRFCVECFWSCNPNYTVTVEDIPWVAEQLMKNGGREAWEVASRLLKEDKNAPY